MIINAWAACHRFAARIKELEVERDSLQDMLAAVQTELAERQDALDRSNECANRLQDAVYTLQHELEQAVRAVAP